MIKETINNAFKSHQLSYVDSIPLDEEIKEFLFKINNSPHIKTTNSCAGHDIGEKGNDYISHPYLAFLVNEHGWNIFFSSVLPQICENNLIHVEIIDKQQKTSIVICCHYEDKSRFWNKIKEVFINEFLTNKL